MPGILRLVSVLVNLTLFSYVFKFYPYLTFQKLKVIDLHLPYLFDEKSLRLLKFLS